MYVNVLKIHVSLSVSILVSMCPLLVSGLRPECLGPASPSAWLQSSILHSPLIKSALSNNQEHAGTTTAPAETSSAVAQMLITEDDGQNVKSEFENLNAVWCRVIIDV